MRQRSCAVFFEKCSLLRSSRSSPFVVMEGGVRDFSAYFLGFKLWTASGLCKFKIRDLLDRAVRGDLVQPVPDKMQFFSDLALDGLTHDVAWIQIGGNADTEFRVFFSQIGAFIREGHHQTNFGVTPCKRKAATQRSILCRKALIAWRIQYTND